LQRAVPFAVFAPGGQSGNFWIHPRIAPAESGLHTEYSFGKSKSKVVPVLLTEHHAMKAYWGMEV